MTDILGEALQKLTPPENAPSAEQSPVHGVTASAFVPTAQPAIADASSAAVVAPETNIEPNQMVDSPAARRNPLRYLQEHRRQAAAIVLAACIAVFWFDDRSSSTSSNSADGDSAQTEAAEEEMMLDEFDAIEITPKREPAEPADVAAADPFPLTIPQMESDAPQISGSGSAHPLLHESIGDVRNRSAVQAESSGSMEFPAQQTSDNSPPANPRSVRFTGRIQPLN